jgi:hypothetical protein
MDAVLTSVASAKGDMVKLTMVMRRDALGSVDIFEYIDKGLDVRIPDEKEEAA